MPAVNDLVFIGFNKQVFGIDRYNGSIVWEWKAAKGTGYIGIMLDGDRLIVNCSGWTWCLDPLTGAEIWHQEFKGKGTGIPSMASTNGSVQSGAAAQGAQDSANSASTGAM